MESKQTSITLLDLYVMRDWSICVEKEDVRREEEGKHCIHSMQFFQFLPFSKIQRRISQLAVGTLHQTVAFASPKGYTSKKSQCRFDPERIL